MAVRQRNLDALHSVSMFPPATVDNDAAATAVDLSDFDGDALLVLEAAASVAGSVKVKVQAGDLADGSDAEDIEGAVFEPLDDSVSHQRLRIQKDDLPHYVRLVFFDRAGAYDAVVSCAAVGLKNRR